MAKPLHASGYILIFLLFSNFYAGAVNLYTYTNAGTSGAWNNPATWTTDPTGSTSIGSAVPGNNDVVTILNGFTVFLTANVSTTGLTIIINNGAVLDLASSTFPTISSLSGSGTLKIASGYFPNVTTNTFLTSAASGATVNYYDFSGAIPTSIDYPNLTISNSTTTDHVIAFANTAAETFTILGNLTTSATGTGDLAARIGSQAANVLNLTVEGNIAIGANTTFGAGIYNAIHTLNATGNMTVNGTVQFSNSPQYTASSNGAVRLNFTGETDRTLACQGPTNLYTLTIDKGVGSVNILSVTSTNVSNLNFYSNGQLITVTQGTLRLGVNVNIPRFYGTGSSNYDLGSPGLSPMMWVDGATVNSGGSALVVYGKFRITSGSFTTLGGQGCVIREEGQYLIEGGTFTTEKFRPSSTASTHRGTFIMSGGTFNAIGTTGSDGNYARFSLPYPEQVFIMSGGTINIRNSQTAAGSLHIGSNAASNSVTGGTINVILSGTAASFPLLSTAALWNLTISRDAGATPTAITLANIGSVAGSQNAAQPLVVQNNFTIEGANAARFTANNLDVTVGGNFVIENGAVYSPGTNTTLFNGSADQAFNISGTITSGLNNMSLEKNSGAVTLAGLNSSLLIRSTLSIFSGILNDGGKTIEARANIHNDAVHTGSGNITLNGTATQTISGDGSGVFGNLILNNSNTPGAVLTSDVALSGTLTLAGAGASLFDIGPYQLWLTSPSAGALVATGAGFSSTKMVRTQGLQSDRGVKKSFGNLSAFTFHFGSGTDYTPATVQLTAAPAAYGALSIKPVDSRHPFVVVSNTRNLAYYWKIISEGFSGVVPGSVSHQFKYLPSQVSPVGDDVNYIPARYSTNGWTSINNVALVDEAARNIYFTGVDYLDGDFTAGIPSAFGTVKIFYSIRHGIWNDTNPATTPWSNVSHTGTPATTYPGANDQVFIGDGATQNHGIAINANGQFTGSISIAPGSTLDIGTTTGHNFGRLENVSASGSGLLRISSATPLAEFPAGDFGLFIRESGGTVEYYTTGVQDFVIPQSSLAPTHLPLISYRHLILTPSAGTTITMPNESVTVYGNMTVQGTTATGKVNLNSANARSLHVTGNLAISGGNLQFMNGTPQTISVTGNITISPNAILDISSVGTAVTNNLTTSGNIVNNGMLDLSNVGGRICNVTFTGAANRSITGSGSVTDFNLLRVSKGVDQSSILNVAASSFTLSGGVLSLELIAGTFRLSSNQVVTIGNGTIFNIPAATRLSANGGTFQLMGGNGMDLRVAGTLEILSGTVNIGTGAGDNSIEYAATGNPTITVSGGTLNVTGHIRRSTASTQGKLTYIQSGNSAVNVGRRNASSSTRGVFEILNPGSSFTMTGGTLRIVGPGNGTSIADVYLQPSTSTVAAGTIEIGSTSTSRVIDIDTTIPLFNLSVEGTSNGAVLRTNQLILRGSLRISNDNYFSTSGLNVSIAGNFLNQNPSTSTALNAGGYRPVSPSQTTTFNRSSSSDQTIAGIAGNLTVFANLIISNTFSGGAVRLQSNSAARVASTLTLSQGTFHDGGNTVTVLGNVTNSAVHASSGSGSITLAGSSAQLLGGSGSGRFGNVVLNNSLGVTFTANQEVSGVLTFVSGSLFINQFSLYISNTSLAAISGADATRYIITSGQLSNGGLRKAFAGSVTNGSFTYPLGVLGKYTPATYTITTGPVGGSITVKPVNSKHPGATGSGTSFIEYYWNVTNSVIALNGLTHTYQYVASDAQGTPSEYRDARFNAGAWDIGSTAGNPDPITRIITFTNTDVAGDYTAGEPTAFVNPTVYISIASGDWESDDSIWDEDPPGTNLGPPAGSFVIISAGHTITINTNTKRPATLDVRGRLNIGTTTGHDFGAVSATGIGERTIQLQSSTFPSGDFSNFVAVNGGTVEFNGSLTLPTQATYNNLVFSGPGTKTLPNADLTLNGDLTILGGTVNNSVSNRNILLANSNADFTNNSTFVGGSGTLIVGGNLINSGALTSFTAPSGGVGGVSVDGDLTNTGGASFIGGVDPIVVIGNLTNHSTFQVAGGGLNVGGNLATSGSFTTGAGAISVAGSLSNSNLYSAGVGATTVGGAFSNSGAGASYAANSNALNITGNFSNTAGAVFHANTGSIFLRGNWTNSSTFNGGTGSVTFGSAAPQTLTGTTTFHNLINSNGGVLNLNSSVVVSGTLSLISGRVVTGSNVMELTNTTAQPVTGQSPSSFIDGRVSIHYPNTTGTGRIFPVGNGTIYRPVAIYQNALSTSPVVRVAMINAPPTGSYPTTIQGLSEARYYSIDLVSGTINNPTVELSFNTNAPADENITIPGNARVVRATAPTGPWTDEDGSGVFSPAAPSGYATSDVTSIASETYFALAYQNIPLPITLGSFDADLGNGVVTITWTTFTETNNAYFTVERSANGLHYDSVVSVDGAGDSREILHYAAIDESPLSGVSYYRLKQTDFDGKFDFSRVVRIENHEKPKAYVSIYPNPSAQSDAVFLKMVNHNDHRGRVLITSVTGMIYFDGLVDLSKPFNLTSAMGNFPGSGIYIVKVTSGGLQEAGKLFIH